MGTKTSLLLLLFNPPQPEKSYLFISPAIKHVCVGTWVTSKLPFEEGHIEAG